MSWLLDSMAARGDRPAVVDRRGECSYAELATLTAAWLQGPLDRIRPGAVVGFDGDYGRGAISLLLALLHHRSIAVPLSADVAVHHESFLALAEAEHRISDCEGTPVVRETGVSASHALFGELRAKGVPGLVLFSSGSTGKHKAAVHDLHALLDKFKTPRHAYRTIVFLQLDHIGGVNTLFYTLANGGVAVVATARTPAAVCEAVETHRVELLPTSPTFLNLLLLSEEHRRHDLSSLTLITYGTEPMPESTLQRMAAAFPEVKLLQTYGLSELGILRSQSRGSDSLWVRVGGEGFETKIVDGRLWIRAASAMLGYLNAPSPFDAEGFFDTGDLVEVDGEWIRFVGRYNEIINVGGSKVFPAEVESVLLEMDNVADAAVRGEPNPITGQMVTATVRLVNAEAPDVFKRRMRVFCADRLAGHKVPVRLRYVEGPLHSERFKRQRRA